MEKTVYNVDEAAESLGVSRSTIYQLIHREDFPTLKIGNRRLIPREGLQRWVRKNTNGGLL